MPTSATQTRFTGVNPVSVISSTNATGATLAALTDISDSTYASPTVTSSPMRVRLGFGALPLGSALRRVSKVVSYDYIEVELTLMNVPGGTGFSYTVNLWMNGMLADYSSSVATTQTTSMQASLRFDRNQLLDDSLANLEVEVVTQVYGSTSCRLCKVAISGYYDTYTNAHSSEGIRPDTLITQTGLTGALSTVSNVDNTYMTGTAGVSSVLRVGMPTPAAALSDEATQYISAKVRMKPFTSGGNAPTATIAVYQSGVQKAISASKSISSYVSPQYLSLDFASSLITDPSNVEIQVNCTASGGKASVQRAIDIDGVWWRAITVGGTAPPPVPSAPTGLAYNTSTKMISWTANASGDNVTNYKVYLDQTSTVTASPTGTSYTFASMSSGSHVIYVSAVNANGESPKTSLSITQPAPVLPDAPTNISYYPSKLIKWSPATNATSYNVYLTTNTNLIGSNITTYPPSYDISPYTTAGNTYDVWVSSVSSGGESAKVKYTFTKLPSATKPTDRVTHLTVTSTGLATWDAYPSQYPVDYYYYYNGSNTQMGNTMYNASPTLQVNDTSVQWLGIAAVNEGGIGPISYWSPIMRTPGKPTKVSMVRFDAATKTVSWDANPASENITSYTVEYVTSSATDYSVSGSTTSFVLPSFTPPGSGQGFRIYVWANNAVGFGEVSNPYNVDGGKLRPDMIQNFKINPLTLEVSWTPPTDASATEYYIQVDCDKGTWQSAVLVLTPAQAAIGKYTLPIGLTDKTSHIIWMEAKGGDYSLVSTAVGIRFTVGVAQTPTLNLPWDEGFTQGLLLGLAQKTSKLPAISVTPPSGETSELEFSTDWDEGFCIGFTLGIGY